MGACRLCKAEYEITKSPNSRDSDLDALLDDMIHKAERLGSGACHVDYMHSRTSPDLTESQAWHEAKRGETQAAKNAVHRHVRENYERDD